MVSEGNPNEEFLHAAFFPCMPVCIGCVVLVSLLSFPLPPLSLPSPSLTAMRARSDITTSNKMKPTNTTYQRSTASPLLRSL